ncbi:MAG: hypothetical protein CMN28_10230 [Salinisphaeraceae bacterium]|nr:hypothetical protein [Salinisphaeraceae bacterium]
MDQISQLSPDFIILIAFALLAILLLGGVIGYSAKRAALREKDAKLESMRKSRDELQRELDSQQSALRARDASDQSYRMEVRGHFETSSEIMSELVQNYRRMYEHLAGGAERLADLKGVEQIVAAPPPEAITRADEQPQDPAGVQASTSAEPEETGDQATRRQAPQL